MARHLNVVVVVIGHGHQGVEGEREREGTTTRGVVARTEGGTEVEGMAAGTGREGTAGTAKRRMGALV